jgi:hypothetical protein
MRKHKTPSMIKKQREAVIKANEKWLNSHEAKPNGSPHPWKTSGIKSSDHNGANYP